jgi:undecaprenyl-diphosphatase
MGHGGGTGWLNNFDVSGELFINQFVGLHPWFDTLVSRSDATVLFKGGVIVLLFWLVLFDHNRPGQLRKGFELLLGSAFFSIFAVLSARALALSLPFRTRPIYTPSFHMRIPAESDLDLLNWSAFPSDHAALFLALATGIFLVSRKAGWLAIAWFAVVVCFPRLYLGIHWPTDILAGSAIGAACTQLARIPAIRDFVRRTILGWHQKHPEVFFALLFLWSYETITLFEDVRRVLKLLAHSI